MNANIFYLVTCKLAREQQHGPLSWGYERRVEFPSWKLAALFTCEYYIFIDYYSTTSCIYLIYK